MITPGDKSIRELIEDILSDELQLVVVDVEKQFVYLDKTPKGWKLTVTKSLLEDK